MAARSSADAFVRSFRASAPYVHAHRGRTFVVAFGGEAVRSADLPSLVHDLALLHALGIRLVVVAGARPQIEARLKAAGLRAPVRAGRRVTSRAALACVKEAAATVRVELEALFSMGLPGTPMAGARVRVASGNFVVARPLGVVGGVDYGFTGEVRRIDAEGIGQRLRDGAVVLLGPLGYSLTGELFNLATLEVAQATAAALSADKLVLLVEGRWRRGDRGLPAELNPEAARSWLERQGRRTPRALRAALRTAVGAVEQGVPRVHLVPRHLDGGLLLELFQRDGIGTLLTEQPFEDIRDARPEDLPSLRELLEPLERDGILRPRGAEGLEQELDCFAVVERDGAVVACAALYPGPEGGGAELGAVAVHPSERRRAHAARLLAYLEQRARALGQRRLLALTTRAPHWFLEHGFRPGHPEDVPEARRGSLRRRGSRVFVKDLG